MGLPRLGGMSENRGECGLLKGLGGNLPSGALPRMWLNFNDSRAPSLPLKLQVPGRELPLAGWIKLTQPGPGAGLAWLPGTRAQLASLPPPP